MHRSPFATGHCARGEPAIVVALERCVDGSSDSGCSLSASSPRFSGASCTSLLPEDQLCRQPVGAETLTEDGPYGQRYPSVAAGWRRAWAQVIPFFAFPAAVRKVIYTTNAIESVNARLRKIIKTRATSPRTRPPRS